MAPSSGAASAAAAAWGPRPQSRFGSGGARAWAMAAREAWCSSGLGGLWAPWRCQRRRFSWRWARAMGNSRVTGSSSSSDHGQSLKSNGARAIDNSCVTGSCLSNQRQSKESNGSDTTFKWRIDGFSSLLDKGEGWTNSSVFDIRGFKWHLMLNPRDGKSGDKSEYVSLKLVMSRQAERPHTVVEATFKFMMYEQSYGKHHEQHQVSHNFQATSRVSGSSCMIPLATLKDQSSGFLVEDSCVFGIQFIKVVVVKSNDVSETLFFQKISNICSDPQVYTWNIDDFFALKNPSNSPEFELCGHKWFITIYPSGNDKNGNHLSLYLRMKVPDALHHDSANLAEISINIKDQESEINNIWKMTWFTGPEPEQEGA